MRDNHVRVIALAILLVAGCGPMRQPMAHRPDDDLQHQIDAAWNRALSPVTKLNREQWLDLFVAGQAYQLGVDTLLFRSEKRFDQGRVVMEVRYDRSAPENDIFEVQVLNHDGAVIREEQYDRQDVESTYAFFFHKTRPADEQKRQEYEDQLAARWKAIEAYFPNAKEESLSPLLPGDETK